MVNKHLYSYLLHLGDNSMILGHRLSELCGHGPTLETDIALTNISLDLFGQVRNIFQYAAQLKGDDTTEDNIAFDRTTRNHYNCILVEQVNVDFAHIITRQFLFDVFQQIQLSSLSTSNDQQLSAIAIKSLKETKYHLRFSSEWIKRLGDGTQESHHKLKEALNFLLPFTHEFFTNTKAEIELINSKVIQDLSIHKEFYYAQINDVLETATIKLDPLPDRFAQGKWGIHTEQLGYILSDFQYMQKTYPNMQW